MQLGKTIFNLLMHPLVDDSMHESLVFSSKFTVLTLIESGKNRGLMLKFGYFQIFKL